MITLNSFLKLVGTIFFFVGLFHFIRLATGVELILGTQSVPLWVSMFGVILPWFLAYTAYRLSNKSGRSQESRPTKRSSRRR